MGSGTGIHAEAHGILGGIGLAAAGLQLGPRNRTIGWSADAPGGSPSPRGATIGRIVTNHHFLLLPGVQIKRLASTVRYGQTPVLLQTFVGPDQSGLSYRAVWLKPLTDDWQATLCTEPRRVLGWSGTLGGGDPTLTDGWGGTGVGSEPHR